VLTGFETCAFRHYRLKVLKDVVEAESDEMRWGNRVHKALENRVKDGTALPETMKQYEPIAAKIIASGRGGYIDVEQKMALTRDYEPCTFFAKDTWVRAITDVTVVKGRKAAVLDYKTGKKSHATAQLKLCAGVTFMVKSEVDFIRTGYLWLADGSVTSETYTRADLPKIWQDFAPRVLRLEQAAETGNYPKKPSGLCREWCPVHDCEHNGKYRGRR
jgi:hypothetical protein